MRTALLLFSSFSSIALVGLAVAACSSDASPATSGDGQGSSGQDASVVDGGPKPNPTDQDASPSDSKTEIVFGIDAENFQSEGFNFTSYKIEVKVDGVVTVSEELPTTGPTLPHETRVKAPKGKTDSVAEIVVKAVMNEADVVTRRATVHFVRDKSLLAYLRLEVRCNNFGLLGGSGVSGPTCDKPSETCVGGKCVSEALDNLPDYRADWATSPPSACGNGPSGSVIAGTGQANMVVLNDNDTLQVECGPQGGHHLWMALSMKDIAQMGTTTTFSASQPAASGGVTIPPTAYPYSYSPGANGSCELTGLRFQLDAGGVNIKDVLGKPLDIKVLLEDKAGHKATITRHVNISPDRAGGGLCRPLT